MKEPSRIYWLDYGKAVSMLLIILFHVCIYYVGKTDFLVDILFYNTSIAFFFFANGYVSKIQNFDFKGSMMSILKRLLIPYLIFTSIIFIPKQLARGNDFDVFSMMYEIFGGIASWFVAALIVSRLALSVILKYTDNIKRVGLFSFILLIIGLFMSNYLDSPVPWNANYGFISLFYIYLGIICKKYEVYFNKHIKLQLVISTVLYLVFYVANFYLLKETQFASLYVYKLSPGGVNLLGIFTYTLLSVTGLWMLGSWMKILPPKIKWLSYIGKNSLVYYYLNTGVILVLTILLNKFGYPYDGKYAVYYALFIVVVLVLSVVTGLINRFAPWMVGDFRNRKRIPNG